MKKVSFDATAAGSADADDERYIPRVEGEANPRAASGGFKPFANKEKSDRGQKNTGKAEIPQRDSKVKIPMSCNNSLKGGSELRQLGNSAFQQVAVWGETWKYTQKKRIEDGWLKRSA